MSSQPQQCTPEDWKEVVPGEKSVPEARSRPSPHQQAIVTAMPGGLPVPKSPNIQQIPAHGGAPGHRATGDFRRGEGRRPSGAARPPTPKPRSLTAAGRAASPGGHGAGPGDRTKEACGPASAPAPRLPEAPPRAAQAPPRASPRPRRRRPREPSRDAPHCLHGGCSPRAPAARAQSSRCPRPRPGLAPPPPFVVAGPAGAVGCAAAAPGPGSEAPGGEEAARPGPGLRARRRPAEGLRRPRPARPSRALDRSVPVRGRGSCQEGSAARAPRAGNRAPPFGATPGPGLLGCQAVPARDSPSRRLSGVLLLRPSSGTLPVPHSRRSLCRAKRFRVSPSLPRVPRTPPPSRDGELPGMAVPFKGQGCCAPSMGDFYPGGPEASPEKTGQGIVHALTDLSSPGMTSGNGNSASSIAGTAPQNGENKPPQAIVKPQILTHVIEGFVIQEGAEPFPVGRSSLLVGNLKKKYAQGFLPEKLPQQDHTTTTDSEMEEPYLQESKEEGTPLKLKCELCGRVDFAYKFKRSKRFCSMACAKRYNVGCTKRVGLFHSDRSKLQKAGATTHNRRRASKASLPTLTKDTKKQPTGAVPLSVTAALQLTHSQEDSSRCSDNSSYEEPLSPISASSSTSRRRQGQRDLELPDMHMRDLVGMGHHFLPSEPTKWNVEDVYEFIRSLPGCQEIAEEFRAQEIDGQALLLLKEDHLMSAMNIKLGPALKIYARISMLKDS
ncbi:hypothetical protein QTO34_018805 [Cnephaeus nilssonii]|uniref:Polyhomeotic homolog 2 n=1 Tax=Cnephaeus nilssonii TaxID=3371016 RepID=A0AA40HZH0_CNENI|nr:hypothetical protein QTO34_018805 [Eptesicus nilssonii]